MEIATVVREKDWLLRTQTSIDSIERTATQGQRLIERGFPCHQVGAETQRERDTGQAPPVNRLHVWWARRPLTPSRAAIVGSLDSADIDPEVFVRQLGIERVQALVQDEPWILTSELLARVETDTSGAELLPVDERVLRRLREEDERRAENLSLIATLKAKDASLTGDPVLARWERASQPLPQPWPKAGEYLPVQRMGGDPAWANQMRAFTKTHRVCFEGDAYGYPRAFTIQPEPLLTGITVLDPTAGGGSIPFEALRLGHTVIANELNPVATVILHATLSYPTQFGPELASEIQRWGNRLLTIAQKSLAEFYPDLTPLPRKEQLLLQTSVTSCPELFSEFNQEQILDYMYARQVTCPHCGGETPLLNTYWLSKEAGAQWGVRIVPDGRPRSGTVMFETYRVVGGRGPHGEDPNQATVNMCAVSLALRPNISRTLFDMTVPTTGDESYLDAPRPLLLASLEAAHRLANGMKVKKSELSTDELLARLNRVIERGGF